MALFMVVGNLDIIGLLFPPPEANSVLVVESNTVLFSPFSALQDDLPGSLAGLESLLRLRGEPA
jgi:hypothetical protein